MWREARGNVLRQQLDDATARLRGANYPAMHGFYGNVEGTIEELREAYNAASPRARKALLEHCRKSSIQMWNTGQWPQALGLNISCLNVESAHLPGEDAAYVKRETDKIIAEARTSTARWREDLERGLRERKPKGTE